MRILVISNLFPPAFLGGYELGCAQMVEALRRSGHSVRVLTSVSPEDPDATSDVSRVLELPPVYDTPRLAATHPSVIEHFHLASSVVNPGNVHAVARTIEEYDPDVIYLWNLLGLGGLGILGLLKQLGIPWVWHIMDMIPRLLCGFGGEPLSQVAREFDSLAEGRYIVCSSRVANENTAGGVNLGEEVHLLPNWVTVKDTPREEFFSGGELRVMCAVGVLGEHKGTDILIETAAQLHDRGLANFTIDIYGNDVDPRFQRMLHEQDVVGTVRLMGSRTQPELLRLYRDYDLFAFPTWAREPFGFAPLEAAACGCVPLFPADCGIAEWLVDGVHCLKAERTPADFTRAIEDVLRGRTDLPTLGRRAQATVCSDFHIDRIAPRAEEILSVAASERPAPRGTATEYNRLVRFADGLLPALLSEAQC